jgi:hypothetical protein
MNSIQHIARVISNGSSVLDSSSSDKQAADEQPEQAPVASQQPQSTTSGEGQYQRLDGIVHDMYSIGDIDDQI